MANGEAAAAKLLVSSEVSARPDASEMHANRPFNGSNALDTGRAAGKGATYEVAVRALAFKWIRILYRCWKDRRPYDELQYLQALRKKGSPLLQYIADAA